MNIPAVILAAGMGRRLSGGRFPKALARFMGMSLLERSIITCHRAGIRRFIVVVGYKGDEVKRHARELVKRYGFDIKVVENPDWEEGNGTSVLAASQHVDDSFLLLMCDHLFEVDMVKKFLDRVRGKDGCFLAVDPRLKSIFDMDDATKVLVEGEEIRDIGKKIESFNGIDMGLFYCNRLLIDALLKVRASGEKCSVTNGVRKLAKEGFIKAQIMDDGFWIDLDTKEAMAYAKKKLMANLSKEDDGIVSRRINRFFSRMITEKLVETSVTPNTITVISFLLCAIGAYLFTLPGYLATLSAGIIIQFSSILDGCDGEIARLKLQSSSFGGWFDTVLDRYGDTMVVAGIAYKEFLVNPTTWIFILSLISLLGFVMTGYAKKEYFIRYGSKFPENLFYKLGRRDLRLFGIFIGAVLDKAFKTMVLLGIFSNFLILAKIIHLRFREWK